MKILKKLRKQYHLDFLVTLIVPISFLVGILGQVSILSQYNAVVAFSWNQVLIDTAILSPTIISAVIGYAAHIRFDKLGLKGHEKLRGTIFLLGCILIFITVLSLIKYLNIYLIALCMFFLLGYFTRLSELIGNSMKNRFNEKWTFTLPTLVFTWLIAIFIVIGSFFHIGYDYLYKQVFVKDGSIDYQVKYMNDKVVIYGEGIIRDRDNEEINIMVNTSLKTIKQVD